MRSVPDKHQIVTTLVMTEIRRPLPIFTKDKKMPSSTLASKSLIHQINFTKLSFFSVSEIADLFRRFNSSIFKFQTL